MNAPELSVKTSVSAEEWQVRVDTAAAYRLLALFGFDDLIFTHISARVPGPEHHFLINPYGLMFDEITASSLIKVDAECQPMIATKYSVNPAGFVIHSAIHEAREDAGCIIHTHASAGVAVSAQQEGLLPISQQAAVIMGSLAYHDYEGIAVLDDEKLRLQKDLGGNHFLILRNHGLLTVASSVADAFQAIYVLQRACEIQVMAQAGGSALIPVPADVLASTREKVQTATRGMGGALAWPGLLRRLNRQNPGYDA